MDCGLFFHFVYFSAISLSSLPLGAHFLLSIHMSVPPAAILPPCGFIQEYKMKSSHTLTSIKWLHSKTRLVETTSTEEEVGH